MFLTIRNLAKIIGYILSLLPYLLVAQSLPESYHFQFKGYTLSINDEITDGQGNHILIGDAKVKENYAKDRDARLDALYHFKDYVIDNDSKGLIISTDAHYNITKLQGLHSYFDKIIWDASRHCYWIGGSSGHFTKDFSYQITLTQLNENKEMIAHTAIETVGNTYLEDFILKDSHLILLGMKMQGEIGATEYIPTILEVDPMILHESKNFIIPQKTPDIIYTTTTEYPKYYRFNSSPLFIKEGYLCFGIGYCIDIDFGIQFYRYKEGKAELINKEGNIKAYHSPYLIGFYPSGANGFLLCYATYFSKKLTIAHTDTYLQVTAERQSKVDHYPDFNQMLVLPNGKLVLLSTNSNHHWCYRSYTADGTFEKEYDTNVSEETHPSLFKILKGNTVLSSFYRSGQDEPAVLQTLNLD